MTTVWLDGRFLPERSARISITDPALSWGVGLFEVVRTYQRRPFRLANHARRLCASAKYFGIPFRSAPFASIVDTLLRRNRLSDACIRIVLTGGGSCFVTARPYEFPSARLYRQGARLTVARWRRDPTAPLIGHKTLNYHENLLARAEALRRGAVDALLLTPKNEILEGTRTNVFLVHHRALVTPPCRAGILPGVIRQTVLEAARRLRIPVRERAVERRELAIANEVFVTNSMLEVLPVRAVERCPVGPPGPVTGQIAAAYHETVKRECRLSV